MLPTQPAARHSAPAPRDHLVVTVYGGQRGSGRLYDDSGAGFGYERGAFSWTRFHNRANGHGQRLRIGAASGNFPGSLATRSWTVRFEGVHRPRWVSLAGRRLPWHYDPRARTVTVRTPELSVKRAWVVRLIS